MIDQREIILLCYKLVEKCIKNNIKLKEVLGFIKGCFVEEALAQSYNQKQAAFLLGASRRIIDYYQRGK